MISITFLGAARTVTGSKYLVESNGTRIMVDAGLFQGLKELRQRNWQDLPVPGVEHRGDRADARASRSLRLPAAAGRRRASAAACSARRARRICARSCCPTPDGCRKKTRRYANRHNFSKHKPALPLYTEVDAFRAVSQLQPCGYDRPMPVAAGIEVEFINAGHLLGSSYVRMQIDGRTILFGGDLGRFGRPVLPDPTPVAEADYLLVESTYGDRVHEQDDNGDRARGDRRRRRRSRGGKLIIPAFAIGRVEELLYWLKRLETEKRIPVLPVFVDSPMAGGRARALHRARARARPRAAARRSATTRRRTTRPRRTRATCAAARRAGARDVRLLHRALPRHRHRRRVEAAHRVEDARPSSSRRAAWRKGAACCTTSRRALPDAQEHGALRRLPGGRHARAPARRRREERQDPRRVDPGRGARSSASTRCRRTPTPTRSCAGSAASPRPRSRPSSSTASPLPQDALGARIKAELGWARRRRSIGESVEL